MSAHHSAAADSASLGRRQFVPGFAILTSVLGAGLSAAGPRWGEAAATAPAASEPLPAPALPAVRSYSARLLEDWQAFRHLFVTADGRVLDTGNGGVSHSEGQGWAMLGAVAADDQQTFGRVYDWTRQVLQRRPYDRLHAWRYSPAARNPVADLNNATDGDIYIAAALARAAAKWQRPDYAEAASLLARNVRGLVRQAGARTVLLPGADGFDKQDCLIVNPSYYAFGLMDELGRLCPSLTWAELRRDGAAMLLQGRFGRWQLPPDWLRVDRADGSLSPAPGWPARFSYDAIRVPLHAAWGRVAAGPMLDSFARYWTATENLQPAWTDLHTGDLAPYPASAGMQAVAAVALRKEKLGRTAHLPSVMASKDYYSAGLVLLSRMAGEELEQAGA